jgi:hypothetical protein
MPLQQADSTAAVTVKNSQGVIADKCTTLVQTCATWGQGCPNDLVCRDFWKGPFCTCPENMQPTIEPSTGQVIGCGATLAVRSLGITNWAVTAIIVCLFLLLRKLHIMTTVIYLYVYYL